MRKGFTLIELMVAAGLVAIMSTFAVGNYRNSTKRQAVDVAADRLKQVFNQAKSYAQAGYKDCVNCGATSVCGTGDTRLDGWRVTVNKANRTVSIQGECPTHPAFSVRLETFGAASVTVTTIAPNAAFAGSLLFKPLGQGVAPSVAISGTAVTYRVSDANISYQRDIVVNLNGEVI